MKIWSFGRSNRSNKFSPGSPAAASPAADGATTVDESPATRGFSGDMEYPVYGQSPSWVDVLDAFLAGASGRAEYELDLCSEVGCEGAGGHRCPHYYLFADADGRWRAMPWGA